MIIWLHELGQNIMVVGSCGRGGCSLHGGEEAEREREEWGKGKRRERREREREEPRTRCSP
jgi:hypothetical protein